MVAFFVPVDIGNRALQHVGAERIATSDFSENSTRCAEVAFNYDKLREAELRRNVWTFATRRAILRPIDTNTMLLSPSLWESTTTYFVGSIVSDSTGNLWQSNFPNNTGNQPGIVWSAWAPYFGPLTVGKYDSSQGYMAGELVYTMPGDGTYNVYASLVNNNSLDPSLPNIWASTTTYFKNDVIQYFLAWASGTTYSQGQTVSYSDGNWYASLVNSNTGNTPSANSTKWALVPALVLQSLQVPTNSIPTSPPSTPVDEWQVGTVYSLGSFALFNGTEYVSIQANNTGNFPSVVGSTWWVALSAGTLYMSLVDLNSGNNPSSAPALWAAGTTYAINNTVGGSDGYIYKSLSNGNVAHDPTLDGGVHWQNTNVLNPWTTVFTLGGGNSQWIQIGGATFSPGVALAQLNITYPIGTGPLEQSTSRNVFHLPAGYLKWTSSDPKAGSFSFLGAPSSIWMRDWLFEGKFIVSAESQPIMLRFIADVTDVSTFDPMFCEGLACRIAVEVCEKLTQSAAKIQVIEGQYKTFMGEARTANGIEVGAEQPPTDDYITTRW